MMLLLPLVVMINECMMGVQMTSICSGRSDPAQEQYQLPRLRFVIPM